MGHFTIQRMAEIYREKLGIGIPHPLPETYHMAKFLGIPLPCPRCPLDFECDLCDSMIEHIYCKVDEFQDAVKVLKEEIADLS